MKQQGSPNRLRQLVTVSSIGLCLGLSVVRWFQPDGLVPVTLVPAWFWTVCGVVPTVAAFRRDNVRLALVGVVAWVAFVVVFVEEAESAVRLSIQPMTASRSTDAGVVRVVSLNCNVGQLRCVDEALAWNPDVVLLQESPGKESLERIASTLFGEHAGVVYGGDVSILVNGTVLSRPPQIAGHFVGAQVELQNGMIIDVVSARLSPPPSRLDFWTSDFWKEHRELRKRHRREVDAIRHSLKRLSADSCVLIGGDFNMPPDDAAMRPLEEKLSDVFRIAGHGWGNTATNEYPLFRVDQIWVNSRLRPDAAVAVRTKCSDHRMVVCDLHAQE